jgi:hypothetical protein
MKTFEYPFFNGKENSRGNLPLLWEIIISVGPISAMINRLLILEIIFTRSLG